MTVVGRNVRWLRTRAGMTQAELAGSIRVQRRRIDASYICRVEKGRLDPRVSTVAAIARVFGLRPWHLLTDLTDNADWWDAYMRLTPQGKRNAQRVLVLREQMGMD